MIRFESVCLSFQDKNIFDNLDLNIQKNEKVLIQGRSGIGKTSLFKLLLGFGKVDSGNIIVNRLKIDRIHINKIREQIFYLSQDIDLKQGVIGDLIDEILQANSKTNQDNNLNELLSFLELEPKLLEQNIKDLSGGERQRIGLLICFLLDRPVWLLDEPTSALDGALKNKVASFILEQNKTIVIISHDNVWKQHKAIKIERFG
jgi:putative ABC transport system ATP-binding protein